MNNRSLSLIALCVSQAFTASAVKYPDKICGINECDAEGHRLQIALNTEAIQKAIDDCAVAGGGTMLVPEGNSLTNPIFLKSNIQLKLDKNATLVASTEVDAYRANDQTKYAEAENNRLPFICSHDVDINGTRILSPWHAPNTDAIDS